MRISFELGSNPSPYTLPLHIAVVGEFASMDDAQPVAVDKDSFADVVRKHAGELLFEVPNHLASLPKQLCINLHITDLTSFTNAGLAAQIPELGRALAFRDQLAALADGSLSYNQFEAELHNFSGLDAFTEIVKQCQQISTAQTSKDKRESGPSPSTSSTETQTDSTRVDAVDRILDMVADDVDTRAAATKSQLEHMISKISSGSKRVVAPSVYGDAVAAAERILSRQLDEILHYPAFQQCEALWRGLKFLIDRTNFREPIYISLLQVEREMFGERIRKLAQAAALSDQADSATDLIVVPFAIENRNTDLEQLQILGETASELQIPALVAMSPAFFQLDVGAKMDTIRYPGGLLSRPEYAKWIALRNKEASRWLNVCCNRFLLRLPYSAEQRNTLGLTESIQHHNDHLWGEPVWLLASLINASFARCGWPTEITGMESGQIEDLHVHSIHKADAAQMQIPLEAMLSGQLAEDLAVAGFTPLICKPNRDSAYLLRAPMLHIPERYDDEAATTTSQAMAHLPYQLLASRISAAIASKLQQLRSSTRSADDIGNAIGQFVQQLLVNTGAGANVAVDVHEPPENSERQQIDLYIHTGNRLVNGADVNLGFFV